MQQHGQKNNVGTIFQYFRLIWHFWEKILVPSWWKPEYLCGLQHIYIWMFFFDYAKVFQVMHAFISYAIWKKIVKVAFDVVKLTLRKRGKNEKGREGRFTLFFSIISQFLSPTTSIFSKKLNENVTFFFEAEAEFVSSYCING